jgi:hypothetical protein
MNGDETFWYDEGIYLFFDNEISEPNGETSAGETRCFPFYVIELDNKKLARLKSDFAQSEPDERERDEWQPELVPLKTRQFAKCAGKIRTLLFVPVKALFLLKDALSGEREMIDIFRETLFDNGLLFAAEMWDVKSFWTGDSMRRWFRIHFPLEPKQKRYAKPPTVLDLLYEFLETSSGSQDDRLALKEALARLASEDRSFVEKLLNGESPKKSKITEEISTRILRALKQAMAEEE